MSDAKTMQELVDVHDELAGIMFLIFISIADCEKDITPHDVRHFHRLVSDSAWTTSEDLRKGLAGLQRNYSSLWGDYEGGRLATGPTAIASALARIGTFVDAPRHADLKRALSDFVSQLSGEGRGFGYRFTLGNESRSRALARSDIRKLFQETNVDALSELATLSGLSDSAEPERSSIEVPPRSQAECKPAYIKAAKAGRPFQPEARGRTLSAASPADPKSAIQPELQAWPAGIMEEPQAIWQSGRIRLRCVSVTIETHDIKTYVFAAEPPCLFSYKPGQFVTIEAPVGERVLRRTYTLSSSPSRPFTLSISVKRVPLGWISNWLWDTVVPGFELDASGPSGHFTCLDHPAPKLLLIAAGIGITPIISMLRWIADTEAPTESVVIYNVRTPADIAFAQELAYLSARLQDRLKLVIVPRRLAPGQSWHGLTGPFSAQLLRAVAEDPAERETFVCGPAGYMDMVESLLLAEGLPRERLHSERFGVASTSPPAATTTPPRSLAVAAGVRPIVRSAAAQPSRPAAVVPATGQATLTFRKSGRTITCAPGETILDAATREGVALESSCRSGVCGACKIKRVRGTVEMPSQQILSEDDIAQGFVLTCVGEAKGDVLLEA